MTKELLELEEIASHLPSDKTLTLDMSRTGKHWLLDYVYFFFRKNITLEKLDTDTCFGKFTNIEQHSPHDYVQKEFEDTIKNYWADKLSVGRVELLAWSKYTVEKDTGLCYIYDPEGYCKGIFCHCMNRVEEYIYVGKSLEDFFDLKSTSQAIQKTNPQDDFPVQKRKLSKEQLMTYDKLLKKDEFQILDAELGFVITLELYKRMIDETFIPLSKNELNYTQLELVDNTESLHFKWHVENKAFEIKLANSNDYIDTKIYKHMNDIVEYLGAKKRFVLFREFGFGQEYGVAYVDEKNQNKLKNLLRVELIE